MGDKALIKKMHLKSNWRVLLLEAPPGYLARLAGLTVDIQAAGVYDCILLFARDRQALVAAWEGARAALKEDGALWIAYPKLSSGVESDLTRDVGWEAVQAAGFRAVSLVALDETWSAVRFKPGALAPQADDPLAAQYRGAKAALRPIYAKILAAAQGLGADVQVQVRQSYVAMARARQFAVLKPTGACLELGLRLKEAPPAARLVAAPGFGSGMITHKVSLAAEGEVDAELIGWLRAAYDGAG